MSKFVINRCIWNKKGYLLIKIKTIEVNIYCKLERIFLRCSSIHLFSVLRTTYVFADRAISLHILLLLLTLNPRNIHIYSKELNIQMDSWTKLLFSILPYWMHNYLKLHYGGMGPYRKSLVNVWIIDDDFHFVWKRSVNAPHFFSPP